MRTTKYFGRGAARTKFTSLITTSRRAILLMVPLLLLSGTFLAAIPVQTASAKGEKFSWIDDSTIEVSGGDLQGTYKIKADPTPNDGMAWNGDVDVTRKEGCKMNFSVGVPEATGNGTTNFGKAMMWAGGPSGNAKNCLIELDLPNNEYSDGQGYKNITVANVGNRNNAGDPKVDNTNDPTDKQIINVRLNTGWNSDLNTPNPSSPPKDSERVPQEDLWILCGNAQNPQEGWEAYRNGQTQVPNYAQMEKDCLNRKSGWVINTTRGSLQRNDGFYYQGKFTGVKYGEYVVCDFITSSCQSVQKQPNKILTIDDWDSPADPFAKVPGSETDAAGTVEEPELACDLTFDLTTIFSLKWLVCPVIDTATFAVGKLEDVINNLLTVDVKEIFDDSAGDNAFHKAWNSFRIFAVGLLVLAALVTVVAQAMNIEIMNAYMLRKIVPRALFAAAFITFSWDALEFIYTFSNDAGNGIRTLIYAPFQELNKDNQLGGGSSFVLALIGTGGALAFGWIGLLSFALTGLIAALTAFAVLVFRKILIMLLVIAAPIGIACYILPNTRKGWEIWKGGVISTVVVVIIIWGMIAIGRVFAVTSFNAPGNQTINQIVAVISYFLPYFMMTAAFRLASGVIATISGGLESRSQGISQGIRNFRGNKMKENMAKMGDGTRFQNTNPLARTFNTATGGVSTFAKSKSKMGFLTDKSVRDAAFHQQRALNAMKYGSSDAAKVASENDPLLRAQTYASEGEARRLMGQQWGMEQPDVEKAIAAAKANGGFGRNQQIYAARQLFATGTGYDNLQQVHTAVANVAGQNEELAKDILGYGNATSGSKGRLDLKVGFGQHVKLYESMRDNGALRDEEINGALEEAVKGNAVHEMLRGKPIAMKNVAPAMQRALEGAQLRAQTSTDPRERAEAEKEAGRWAGIIEQFAANGAYASPKNVQQTDEIVVQPTVNVRQTVQQQSSATVMRRDPATGRLTEVRDTVIDPATGRPAQDAQGRTITIPRPNVNQSQDLASGYNQQRPRSIYDPNDPRNQ